MYADKQGRARMTRPAQGAGEQRLRLEKEGRAQPDTGARTSAAKESTRMTPSPPPPALPKAEDPSGFFSKRPRALISAARRS
jgi:hypothetical protein